MPKYQTLSIGRCPRCNRSIYASRKDARASARRHQFQHKSAYRCPGNPQWWHFGELPPVIRRGMNDRSGAIRTPDERN